MSRCPVILTCSLLLMAGAAAVSCRPTLALADPPAPAADSAKAYADSARAHSDADQAKLEEQLEAARKQLAEAAHQVAELTAQLSRPVIESFVNMDMDMDMDMEGGHDRAIIGVQLEATPGGQGARVRAVSPGGPAAEAGIRAGDVIVAVNGTEVKGENPARQVMMLMHAIKPDSKVSVRVLREGTPRDFTVVARQSPGYFFAKLPPFTQPLLSGPRGPLLVEGPVTDMELATLTPQLGRYFGSDQGVLVVRAPSAGALKLEDGDVILAIDGRQPTSGSHATRILASYQPGEKVTLRIVRLHKTLEVEATLPERAGHRQVATGESRPHRAVPMPPAPPLPQAAPLPPPALPDKVMMLRDAGVRIES
ncbi:MAG TPA: PDZ domain-containing protein [Steroidobacteraceae bacterium]|nr:PDZ domain-containing protein [Steroidobacteraceae bacterium]